MSSAVRVVHIIDSLSRGGAERQLLLLHERLLAAGHDSSIAYLGPPAPLLDDHRDLPAVHDLKTRASKQMLPRAATAVRHWIAQARPDVVHSSLMHSDLATACAPSFVPKVATLCNILDVDIRRAADPRVRPYRMALANRLWGWALGARFDRIIAISEAVKASGERSLGLVADRITVVPRAFTFQRPAAVARNHAVPLLLAVGRLVAQKGHDTLLKALADPRLRARRWRCEIVGDGPNRATLERLITDLALGDRVRLVGAIPRAAARIAAASVFVFPSRFEGLGVAAVEAASMAVPSILSSIPALREIVPDERYGWLAPPDTPTAWADAIIEVLDDPNQAERRARALGERTRRRFSPEAMVASTLEVYERVLRQRKTRTSTR